MEELTCKELVELVTAYLDDALSSSDRTRFEAHLRACTGCVTHLEQMRFTIASVGRLTPDDVPPAAVDDLLAAFRSWTSR